VSLARSYGQKFRPAIIQSVEEYFRRLFGVAQGTAASYEQWLVFSGINPAARRAILGTLPAARLFLTDAFIRNEVLPAISRWRSNQPVKAGTNATLPANKLLLKLLDLLNYRGMLTLAVEHQNGNLMPAAKTLPAPDNDLATAAKSSFELTEPPPKRGDI
jgi:hypothetical protein